MSMPSIWELILRLALSALFGGAVGLEREFRLKEAGVRTHLIVSLASCLMMVVSKYGFFDVLSNDSVNLDPSRIAAGIVTAIGFLGAGTIFSRGHTVTGLTTAAGLWATVGIGMTVGAGMYLISAFSTVFIVVIQAILHRDLSILSHPNVTLSLRLADEPDAMERLTAALTQLGFTCIGTKYERADGGLSVKLELGRLPCPPSELNQRLLPLTREPYIMSIQW